MIDCRLGLYRMVSAEELKEVVGELGGQWDEREGEGQGVIEEDGARVFASRPYPADRCDRMPGEMEVASPPEVVNILEMTIMHDQKCPDLALRVIGVMLRRWGGVQLTYHRLGTIDDWW